MAHNPKFGPYAQTVEQRQRVLEQLKNTFPELLTKASPQALALYQLYVVGNLSWEEVRSGLNALASQEVSANSPQNV